MARWLRDSKTLNPRRTGRYHHRARSDVLRELENQRAVTVRGSPFPSGGLSGRNWRGASQVHDWPAFRGKNAVLNVPRIPQASAQVFSLIFSSPLRVGL